MQRNNQDTEQSLEMRMATNQYCNENGNIIPFHLSSMMLMLMTAVVHIGLMMMLMLLMLMIAVVHIGLSGWENGQDEDEGNVLKHSGSRSPGLKCSGTLVFSCLCIDVQLVLICMILSLGRVLRCSQITLI